MPTVKIDGRETEVPPGATILDAARRLGIDIPTLCHRDGYEPSGSCLVCVVKVRGQDRFVPSCAARAVDGMEIESETDEVHRVRRAALELLLGDHLGDCVAPCQLACPAHVDVPLMLRQIRDGEFRKAIATIKRDVALPATLGRVCARSCEKACRRAAADAPVDICRLKAQVAEDDLARDTPYSPPRNRDSGRRVAILGAGPSGLSAAYHLLQSGHRVAVFDERSRPGGRLRDEFDPATLPGELLDAEIAQIVRLGAELRLETTVDERSFKELRTDFDAVLICCGAKGRSLAARWGLATKEETVQIDKGTYRTNLDGVFAAGSIVRTGPSVVRSVADGKEAAAAIDAYLAGEPVPLAPRIFTVRSGRLTPEEVSLLIDQVTTFASVGCLGHSEAVAQKPPGATAGLPSSASGATGVSPVLPDQPHGQDARGTRATAEDSDSALGEARRQAARCLHCDCRGKDDCRLKRYAEQYDARPTRYQGTRRKLVLLRSGSGVIYEPGKCIDCGLCIQAAARRRDVLGLTFIGRGFDVRVGVPFDRSLDEALGELAAECVAVCPTAALVMDDRRVAGA